MISPQEVVPSKEGAHPMDLQLVGKVAIVTGASQGIGRSTAETLASEGMRVVLVARSRDKLDQVAASCGTECLVHAADLRDPEAPAAVVASTMERFGQLDVLVNNAGATRRGDFLALPDADWADGFALKFFGAMRCCRAAWPHLVESRGAIVNIVGIGGRTASAEFTIGGAVNSALLNLTKSLADCGQGGTACAESTPSIPALSPRSDCKPASGSSSPRSMASTR